MTTSSPKVVHLVPALDTGGMERVVAELAQYRQGPTSITCLQRLGALGEQVRERGESISALPSRQTTAGRILQLRHHVRRVKADVLHCHNLQAFTFGAAATAGLGIRLVLTKHGMRMPKRVTWGERFRVAMARRSMLVGVSNEIRELLANWTRRSRNVHLIRNGIKTESLVDIGEAQPTVPDSPLSKTAVVVARLGPEKDHATLLAAIPHIVSEVTDFKLQIIGDGPLRGELENRVQQLGIANQVTFLGERQDVAHWLSRADLLVLTSITEGTPICLLEAMSVGLPIVATRVGGVPDLISDGVEGLLVAPQAPAEVAKAIVKILSNDTLARKLASRGKARVATEFSVEQMLASYERLYNNPEESP